MSQDDGPLEDQEGGPGSPLRPLVRTVLVALGLGALAVAVVTAPIPGFPSSAFLLLAIALLARSSPRLEAWVRSRPVLRHWIERLEGASRWQQVVFASIWLAVLLASAWWVYG